MRGMGENRGVITVSTGMRSAIDTAIEPTDGTAPARGGWSGRRAARRHLSRLDVGQTRGQQRLRASYRVDKARFVVEPGRHKIAGGNCRYPCSLVAHETIRSTPTMDAGPTPQPFKDLAPASHRVKVGRFGGDAGHQHQIIPYAERSQTRMPGPPRFQFIKHAAIRGVSSDSKIQTVLDTGNERSTVGSGCGTDQ